ncbi:MBOAT family O-acyltransferase [Mucilaginibacter aquaedulcis]|uniref:MBOAT family O-acyltransferase n=1 Tax=Mucilaginibacter aquaedulcis TaxID=1187081 RepID=UPI0025B30ADB|nr:MBOAT family O-acyltransferase [Mucilaginibacter aquaedulcis]MDN3548733.1 MBOAT family O-acyltransferase [Mucilaginibacter aquaedulcis]
MYFKPTYILIIFFTIIVDYSTAILISLTTGIKRKIFLIISLVTNIGILTYFKYFNFLTESFNSLSRHLGGPQIPLLDLVLPIGLSFHTFQAMSYTIEVYRNNQKPELHFGRYSLYVLFYPQMVAGPIERPQQLLPQLNNEQRFNKDLLIQGVMMMILGLFKKVVIADRLGIFVDGVFANPNHHSALDLLLGTYFFSFQIYCDFSGYTDMAIGAGLMLGIRLMQNFNMPYLSLNIAEFWKRWHISLSTWFRDYLYIPLGGNRGTYLRTSLNIVVVFLVSGLWHGANCKYLIWGMIHSVLLIAHQLFNRFKLKISSKWLRWAITFNLISLTWIFFRADTLKDGWAILHRIITVNNFNYTAENIIPLKGIVYCCAIIGGLTALEWSLRNLSGFSNFKKMIIGVALCIGCYFLGVFSEAQFIYFQF